MEQHLPQVLANLTKSYLSKKDKRFMLGTLCRGDVCDYMAKTNNLKGLQQARSGDTPFALG